MGKNTIREIAMKQIATIIIIVLLVLCGCSAKYTKWCDSKVGKDYHEVVNKIGYPERTIEMPNGNKTMIFYHAGGLKEYKTKFETDADGQIIGWSFVSRLK